MELITQMHWRMWQPVTIEVDQQGSLLKVKRLDGMWSNQRTPQSHNRGIVTHFSRKSRKRMTDTIARLDKKRIKWGTQKPKFITLTYAANVTDHKKASRDMKVFIERIQERHPKAAILWRKEQQERDAIHFHLMVFNTPFMHIHTKDGVKGLQQHWNEVSGNPDDNRNSLDLVQLETINGVAFYVSKYMAKPEEEPEESEQETFKSYERHGKTVQTPERPMGLSMLQKLSQGQPAQSTGRWWGVYGRKYMPWATRVKRCHTIPLATLDQWLREHVKSGWASVERSFTVYRGDALTRYDGLLKIMAPLCNMHEQYEENHERKRSFMSWNWRRNSYAPMFLYGMMRGQKSKRSKVYDQVMVDMGVGPWGTVLRYSCQGQSGTDCDEGGNLDRHIIVKAKDIANRTRFASNQRGAKVLTPHLNYSSTVQALFALRAVEN